MKKNSVRAVLKSLKREGVRYLVAGGLAVNAHGILRFTADVDLVVQLAPENVRKTFAALGRIGYRPTVPVTADGFADRKTREGWIRDKGMMVLRFYSDAHRETSVDVFVKEPFVFDREFGKALVKNLTGIARIRFVSLDTMLKMKRAAGRPKDIADIEDLKRVKKRHENRD